MVGPAQGAGIKGDVVVADDVVAGRDGLQHLVPTPGAAHVLGVRLDGPFRLLLPQLPQDFGDEGVCAAVDDHDVLHMVIDAGDKSGGAGQ